MAGKRQHYIPRLLQRGFLHDSKDEAERTWLHRRGAEARLVGIRDVGVEDWFYSRKSLDGTPTLDDAITDLESELGAIVGAWRETAPGTSIDAATAARTVVHLVIRTAHLRRILASSINSMMRELEALFTDNLRIEGMLGLTGPNLASAVMEAIRSGAMELAADGIPPEFSERLMAFVVREMGDHFVSQIISTIGPLFPDLLTALTDKIRHSHNSMIAKPLDDNGWMKALTTFYWTVEEASDLILPDAVALAGEDNSSLGAMLFSSAADVSIVLIPVTPERVVVGRRHKASTFNLSEFNLRAAATSEAFFVSASASDSAGLTALIGTSAARAIEETITSAIREAEGSRSLHDTAIGSLPSETFTQREFSYDVRLADFGDDILAKEFGDVLQGVVGTLSRYLPLHGLDGITIAVDYGRALRELDRGDPSLPPVTSSTLGYGIGVAKPVSVIRENVRKEHLVIAAELADTWLSTDPAERAAGLYTLVKMLAGVAHTSRFVTSQGNRFTPDPMAQELHMTVASAPAEYWSAKEAAFIDPSQAQKIAQLVIQSLEFTRAEVDAQRALMKDDTEIGPTVTRGLQCISATLSHVADWLGHRDGLNDEAGCPADDLPEQLKPWGLDRWLDLFGRDLSACYTADGDMDLSVVMTLSRHVERLMWTVGIYCWPDDDGVRCLVTDRPFALPLFDTTSDNMISGNAWRGIPPC